MAHLRRPAAWPTARRPRAEFGMAAAAAAEHAPKLSAAALTAAGTRGAGSALGARPGALRGPVAAPNAHRPRPAAAHPGRPARAFWAGAAARARLWYVGGAPRRRAGAERRCTGFIVLLRIRIARVLVHLSNLEPSVNNLGTTTPISILSTATAYGVLSPSPS